MKKEYVIPAVVVILFIAAGLYWYLGVGDDVKIVSLNPPPYLTTHTVGQLSAVLQNNESHPVNVKIEAENAFVGQNGTSHPASRLVISKFPQESEISYEYVPLSEEISLLPGENVIAIMLGYYLPGTYKVKVKVYQSGKLIDEGTASVRVPAPDLSIKLKYEKDTTADFVLYRIDGVITNKGLSAAFDVLTNITIVNDKTGEVISYETNKRSVQGRFGVESFSTWNNRPAAYIELARNIPSDESYMPVLCVAKGRIGDRYRVIATATWYDQVAYDELVIPPEE